MTFLLESVKAWMQGDLTKAVHVLVPQIEHGLRRIADKLGEPVTKQHRKLEGVGVSIGISDMLNGRLAEALGPDLTYRIEAELAGCIAIIELDHIGVEEHLRSCLEIDAMLSPVFFLLGVVPLEVHDRLLNLSIWVNGSM